MSKSLIWAMSIGSVLVIAVVILQALGNWMGW